MLKQLSIENYALIDRLEIDFAAGLNIITGETGAGKSILLGALGLILGGRTDVAVLRDKERNCVIEAQFNLSGYGLEKLFEELDLDYAQECVVRRVITPAGKSRVYINDLPTQLTALRQVGDRLIDIHSQHQTLLLGENRFQIHLVDSVAAHGDLMERYRTVFHALSAGGRELKELTRKAEEERKDQDYIAFQLEQLRAAKLVAGEQEELERLLGELTHASEIKETLLYAAQALDGDETAVLVQLKSLEHSLGRLEGVYPKAEEFHTRMRSVLLELRDLSGEITQEGDRIEADPRRLEQVKERLDTFYTLQQKHQLSSVAELLELQSSYEQSLAGIEGFDEAIRELTVQLEKLDGEARKLAKQITTNRKRATAGVEKHVREVLGELGMPAAQLKIEITPLEELTDDGCDRIQFLFTANRNAPLQFLEKVVSGGELSRLMLALKALVAHHTQLPTLIFDEIDTGVSGSIADKMGEIIARLAADLQIINITHLPQVASKGDHHFQVYKQEEKGQTITRIRKLSDAERVDEIAKMLSGTDVTSAAREQASFLLRK